jgi:hypothetical protein
MKKLITNKLFRTLTILLLLTLNGGAFAFSECTYNAQNQVNTDMDTTEGLCLADPIQRRVQAYKIGLCTELPYNTNYKTVCDFIYDSGTAIELIAEKGVSRPLGGIGNISLIEGKLYTHSVLLISNTSSVKALLEFPSERLGRTGQGTYCWSNGRAFTSTTIDNRATYNAECGTLSEANPQFNTETTAHMADVTDSSVVGFSRNFPNWDGGWTNILLSNEDDIATFDLGVATYGAATSAVYWLAGRGIDGGAGLTVTANTTTLDLQFLVSFGSLLGWKADDHCATTSCLRQISIGGFDFTASVN